MRWPACAQAAVAWEGILVGIDADPAALQAAAAGDPRLRVLILDPHNEFASAFGDLAVVIDTDTLDLPFWLFRLEEFAEVVFRGRTPVAEEMDILRDLIPEAKRAFRGSSDNGLAPHPHISNYVSYFLGSDCAGLLKAIRLFGHGYSLA